MCDGRHGRLSRAFVRRPGVDCLLHLSRKPDQACRHSFGGMKITRGPVTKQEQPTWFGTEAAAAAG